MLRQVIIFYKQPENIIFRHNFALAFGDEALETLFSQTLKPYIVAPIEGKIISKPTGEFQSHFGMKQDVFFLFITDMADRPKTLQDEVKRAQSLFFKNFKDPNEIKNESIEQEEFLAYINDTHYYLHPKIVLAGPLNSGKTTIKDMLALSSEPEKKIMNFAHYFQIKLENLYFDLWDFILEDNFSPLWNNFARGSDQIFIVLNGCELSEAKIKHFKKLLLHEGKFSNITVILTHNDRTDFKNKQQFLEIYSYFNQYDVYEINLTESGAKEQIMSIFIEAIGLIKPLPLEFRQKLVLANQLVSGESLENYNKALPLLNELLIISEEYQKSQYRKIFENKIIEVKEKLNELEEQKKIEASKITAPEKIDFGGVKGVKQVKGLNLLGTKSLPTLSTSKTLPPKEISIKPEISTEEKELTSAVSSSNPFFSDFGGSEEEHDDTNLESHIEEPIPIPIPSNDSQKIIAPPLPKIPSFSHKLLEKSLKLMKDTQSQGGGHISYKKQGSLINADIKIKRYSKESEILGKKIRDMGESLSMTLCEKFIERIKQKMNKEILNDADITKAAELYVAQRRKRK